MKYLVLFFAVVFTLNGNAENKAVEESLIKNRSLVKQFGQLLKKELITAMKTGGPLLGVEVCNIKSPEISRKLGIENIGEIERTSLKYRNESNAPDLWEKSILKEFDKRLLAGEKIATIEEYKVVNDGGKKTLHYMKAIPTGGVCLTCHGTNLEDKLEKKINAYYPNDKAKGYQLGEIRGAFTFKTPIIN